MQWDAIAAPNGQEITHLMGLGQPALLAQPNLTLLSSAKAPAGIMLAIHDLAQQWRRQGPVIWSGFQSPVENEALSVLLRGPQPLVVWLARGPLQRLPENYLKPLDEGRLLVVTPFDAGVRRATVDTAQQRNRLLARAADAVLVAHAEPGSKTYSVAAEVLAAGKRVYTIEHAANRELLAMGAQVYTVLAQLAAPPGCANPRL